MTSGQDAKSNHSAFVLKVGPKGVGPTETASCLNVQVHSCYRGTAN